MVMVVWMRAAVVKMVINYQLIRCIVEIEPTRLNYGLDSECEGKMMFKDDPWDFGGT